jgi:BppU N-terminal domain
MPVEIKQGDTRPLDVALVANRKPVPLAGSTIAFFMAPKIEGIGTVIQDGAVEIVDAAKAKVRYEWQPGETDRAGVHRAEFRVTFSDGVIETFPSGDYLEVEIVGDVELQAVEPPPEPAPPEGPIRSLTRFYGPPGSTALNVDTWTTIPLVGTPYQPVGDPYFEQVVGGPDDGGVRCLEDGIYSLVGAVIFLPSQQTGQERAVWVTSSSNEVWNLLNGGSPFKTQLLPISVSGEAWITAGEIITLKAFSDTATSTTENPNSEFLSVVRIA